MTNTDIAEVLREFIYKGYSEWDVVPDIWIDGEYNFIGRTPGESSTFSMDQDIAKAVAVHLLLTRRPSAIEDMARVIENRHEHSTSRFIDIISENADRFVQEVFDYFVVEE